MTVDVEPATNTPQQTPTYQLLQRIAFNRASLAVYRRKRLNDARGASTAFAQEYLNELEAQALEAEIADWEAQLRLRSAMTGG